MNLVRKLSKQLSFFLFFIFLNPDFYHSRVMWWPDQFWKILQILKELFHKIKYILCWHSWSWMIVLQVSTVPLQIKKFLKTFLAYMQVIAMYSKIFPLCVLEFLCFFTLHKLTTKYVMTVLARQYFFFKRKKENMNWNKALQESISFFKAWTT